MAETKPSFSLRRKWSIGFNVIFSIAAVLAIVVAANYIGTQFFFKRFELGKNSHTLSPRTISLLHTLTNDVKVTVYFDKDEWIYRDIVSLLNEYNAVNSKITIETVDYYRSAGAAEEVKAKYNLASSTNRNLVIFDCAGRFKIVPGDTLLETRLDPIESTGDRPEFRRKPVAFNGEVFFSAALLQVMNSKPLIAYFLEGHGGRSMDDEGNIDAYKKFADILRQNYIQPMPFSFTASNSMPADCDLLIIAGPKDAFQDFELEKIDEYLNEGGRLFALFNYYSVSRDLGLEKVLTKWGVHVSHSTISDPEHSRTGRDVIIENFVMHPLVESLIGSRLHMVLPRIISKLELPAQTTETTKVDEVAFSGIHSVLAEGATPEPRPLPLMVAVEKSAVRGVVTERGTTRILVAGDSFFVGNQMIDSAANRDFAGYAANWLLDRTFLLQGIGPRPVTEYRLLMTKKQLQTTEWILLAVMPGAVLIFGWLVWLRRRQ